MAVARALKKVAVALFGVARAWVKLKLKGN